MTSITFINCGLGVRKMRLLTNNPKRMHSIAGYGLEIVEQLPIEVAPNKHNLALDMKPGANCALACAQTPP